MAEIKRFNWVRRPTSWESVQAWRTQSSSVTQRFLSDGAQNNLASGMANLAAQASLQRVQAEIKAKSQSALTANSVNQLA